MRLMLGIFLAFVISFAVGFGVMLAASAIFTCRGDPAGCGLAQAYRTLLIPVECIAVLIAFGLSMLSKRREAILKRTMLTLLLVPVFLILLGLGSDLSSGRSPKLSDVLDLLQLALPFWSVVMVQWWMAQNFVRRRYPATVQP